MNSRIMHHQSRVTNAPLRRSGGFTIVELMVATLVFTTVLLVITTGVLYFSKAYYGSINRSKTQNTARGIISSVTQAIQFTGTTIATTDDTGANYFCAGGKIYVWQPGVQYQGAKPTQSNPGLYVVQQPSGCAALGAGNYNSSTGQELLGTGMRIANLKVSKQGGQLYTVSLTLLYGSDDTLTATTGSGAKCKLQTGLEFCAASSFNTTVERRLQDNQLSN